MIIKKYDSTNNVIFLNGRKDSANRCIIGINPSLETYEGYDGNFPCYGNPLTKEERIELADHMIELWNKYKEVDVNNPSPDESHLKS